MLSTCGQWLPTTAAMGPFFWRLICPLFDCACERTLFYQMRFQPTYSFPRFNLYISHLCLGIGQSPFFHSCYYFFVDFLAFFLLVFLHCLSPFLALQNLDL